MAKQFDIYQCATCGALVEVLHGTTNTLTCCGAPMKAMPENTVDAAREKHVPVIEALPGGGSKVKVGSVPHPMMEKHWIQFIEVITKDGHHCKKHLAAGDAPEAVFGASPDKIAYAREFCNLHGLWRS